MIHHGVKIGREFFETCNTCISLSSDFNEQVEIELNLQTLVAVATTINILLYTVIRLLESLQCC